MDIVSGTDQRMSIRTGLHLYAAVVACALLAGCAGAPRIEGPVDLQTVDRWQAHGRLGVSGAEGGGSGSFEWSQQRDRADVQIRGPVGIGGVRLHVEGDTSQPHLSLETSDGRRFESAAAWDELEARLGASVPAGKLRYWMLGLPAPGEHHWTTGATAEIRVLEQDGWRIEYQQFADQQGTPIPTRIRASSGEARVRIVIDRWQFGG